MKSLAWPSHAVTMGIERLKVRGDSDLVVSQINRNFEGKDPRMIAYREAVQ